MRRLGRVVPPVLVVLLILVALSVRPFIWPATGDPAQADAVVVLSGDPGERLDRAMELIDGGVSSVLVLLGTLDSQRSVELCRGGQAFDVVCPFPSPGNTRQEARAVARLVAERGWRRIVVATSTYHVTRSALLFDRCVDGQVVMVDGRSDWSRSRVARAIAREWAATAYLLTLSRDC